MAKKLGNGETTSLLFDIWLSGIENKLINLISENQLPAVVYNWQVANIVENGNWTLRDQALQPVWHLITQQVVPYSTETDSWHWKCTSSGMFNFNSAWNLVRARNSNSSLQT